MARRAQHREVTSSSFHQEKLELLGKLIVKYERGGYTLSSVNLTYFVEQISSYISINISNSLWQIECPVALQCLFHQLSNRQTACCSLRIFVLGSHFQF